MFEIIASVLSGGVTGTIGTVDRFLEKKQEPRYKRTMRNSDMIFEYADPFMLEEQIRDSVPCDVEPEEEKDEEF